MEEPFPSPSQDKPRTRVLREKINETEPEGIGVGTSFEIALSPAEIVRATENLEFGQHILEAFEAFLEKSETIQKEDVLRLAEAAEQGMTDAQKTVFTKVVQRILEAYQKTDKTYIRDGVETIKRFFVLQILEGQRHKNHKTSLYDKGGRIIGVLDSIVASNPSKMPHITTTPFGSFIVYVDNSDDWQLMTGVALNPIVGFKADVRPPALQEILIEKGFVPEQLDKINRTIFLANSPENQADIQEVKKHELFHDF